jgi:hypothetical protein
LERLLLDLGDRRQKSEAKEQGTKSMFQRFSFLVLTSQQLNPPTRLTGWTG